MKKILTVSAMALTFCASALAEHHESNELDRPYFYASESQLVTAEVQAINHETREVTVLDENGDAMSFIVSKEARNLPQVQVGDVIVAEYVDSVTVEVIANEGMEPEAVEMAALARAKEGDMPGVAAVDTQIVTAVVEDINIAANTFNLRDSDGIIQEYTARNPDNLKRAKVGDLVVMTFTHALAISVEHHKASSE